MNVILLLTNRVLICSMKILFLIMFLVFSNVVNADQTSWAKIRQMNYSATADFLFFITTGKWEVKSGDNITCEPTYIQVTKSVLGRDKMLSIGLAAHMAGKEVMFHGECGSNINYFEATYIVIR